MLYFSFMTLTTTGYGDFVPVDHVTRALASLEAFVGVFYPAIVIARMVRSGGMVSAWKGEQLINIAFRPAALSC